MRGERVGTRQAKVPGLRCARLHAPLLSLFQVLDAVGKGAVHAPALAAVIEGSAAGNGQVGTGKASKPKTATAGIRIPNIAAVRVSC